MVNEGVRRPQLETHVECLLFCFLPMIQLELNDVVKTWNIRQVRQSSSSPGGEPDILYHLPETVGYSKMGLTVSGEYLAIAGDTVGLDHHTLHRNKAVHELLTCYVQIHYIKIARDAKSGLAMYVELLRHLDSDGFLD